MTARTFTGVMHNLPMRDYIAAPGISKHAIDAFLESPRDYQDYITGAVRTEQTRAMLLGSLIHAWILEGKREWIVAPATYQTDNGEKEWNRNATFCREWEAEQVAPILSGDEQDWLLEASAAVRSNKRASSLLGAGQPEVSLFAEGCKGRVDWLTDAGLVDIKTIAAKPTQRAMQREIVDRNYHLQAGLYVKLAKLCGLPKRKFYFVFVSKTRPVRVNTVELAPSAIIEGMQQCEKAIAKIQACQKRNEWPDIDGPGEKIAELDIPAWAYTHTAEGSEPDWMKGDGAE